MLWAQPDNLGSHDCTIKVVIDAYKDILLRLRVEKESKNLIHTIVLKKAVFVHKNDMKDTAIIENGNSPERKIKKGKNENAVPENSFEILNISVKGNEDSEITKRITESNPDIGVLDNSDTNKSPFKLESYFSLSGGTQSLKGSSFMMNGEIIVAGKNKSGIFFQGAGKTVINNMLKQYGFSVGAGFEPGKLGFFLFGDLLLHKFGDEFNSTTHFQIRPSFRYRLSDKVHLSGF